MEGEYVLAAYYGDTHLTSRKPTESSPLQSKDESTLTEHKAPSTCALFCTLGPAKWLVRLFGGKHVNGDSAPSAAIDFSPGKPMHLQSDYYSDTPSPAMEHTPLLQIQSKNNAPSKDPSESDQRSPISVMRSHTPPPKAHLPSACDPSAAQRRSHRHHLSHEMHDDTPRVMHYHSMSEGFRD
jgi:hypothetical protein